MPELPEVEAAKRLLERGCVGKKIEKAVVADDDKVFEGTTPGEVRRALEGRRVVHAHRKGKYLWLELDNPEGPWPLLHFGMTGGIVVQKMGASKYKRIHLESDPDQWPPRFTKLELDLEGGAKLAFVDARRFARVKLQVNPPAQEPLSKLGFDVLDQLPPPEQFIAAVRKRVVRAPGLKIKALLLDQEFCSGIGNWVGDEVLYQARIHPEQSASSLDDASLTRLHGAIRSVVGLAVEAEADSERFPKDWLFHYRWTNKKKTGSINGHSIDFVTVGSRTSAFVPALQKLTGGDGGGGGGGKPKAGGVSRRRGRASAKRSESEEEEEEESEEEEQEEEAEEEEEDRGKGKGKGGGAKAAAKRKGKAGDKSAAAAAPAPAAAARRAAGGRQRVQKRKASDSDEEDQSDSGGDGSGGAREASSSDGDGSEEHQEVEVEEAPRKRARGKAPAQAAAKKKGSGGGTAAAAAKRQAAPRGRKAR